MSGRSYRRSKAASRQRKARARRHRGTTYKGRGFYKGFGKDVGGAVGYMGSKALGVPSEAAAKWVGGIGQKVGNWFSKLTGWGEYAVNRNSLLRPINARIRNHPLLKEGTHIKHREYIGEIRGSQAFDTQYELPINPGLTGSFPWASGVAQQFQQYIVNGAVFEYVPSSGDAVSGTNAALGQVMFAVQYDSLDASFVNKQQLLNESWSQAVVPSQPVVVPIECAPMQTSINTLYTRTGAPPDNSDVRLYDLGKLTVATEGQQATGNVLGSLYISYDIILLKPTLSSALALAQKTAHFDTMDGATPALPFGNGYVRTRINTLGVILSSASRTLTLPKNNAGKFMIRWMVDGSATVGMNASAVTVANASPEYVFLDGNSASISLEDEAQGLLSQQLCFKITDPSIDTVFTWDGTGVFPTAVTGGDLMIWQINEDYV